MFVLRRHWLCCNWNNKHMRSMYPTWWFPFYFSFLSLYSSLLRLNLEAHQIYITCKSISVIYTVNLITPCHELSYEHIRKFCNLLCEFVSYHELSYIHIRMFCNLCCASYCVMNYPMNIYGSFGTLLGDFMSRNNL